ncbi:MAG TPA: ATP-binding protein [Polyangiaceae bacterium]
MTSDPPASEQGSPIKMDHAAELEHLRLEHGAFVRAFEHAIRDTTRLTRLFAVLNESAPLEQLLDRVLATLSELFISDIVVLLETAETNELRPLVSIGLPASMERAVTWSGYAQAALSSQTPIAATEAQNDGMVEPALRELGVETTVWLPVAGDDGIRRGVLGLARCRPLAFAPADVDLLVAMAYRVGLLVERAHAERARQMLELQLRQAAKAESLGRMAGAVAHHFNNTLAVVVASLDLALEDLPPEHATRGDVMRAREAAMRAATTGELMLAYIGQDARSRESVDLGVLLRKVIENVRKSLAPNVELHVSLDATGITGHVSPPQVVQMVGHLIDNAYEAVGARDGHVWLSLSRVANSAIDQTHASLVGFRPSAMDYACIEVADDGCGMAPDTVEKIFDPFFTTKFVGRGLGLAVVIGTVRAHDGHISVQSVLGKGTTVRVYLPQSHHAVPKTSAVVPMAAAPRPPGPALALVAEDEVILRRTTSRILGRMGYRVIMTADGLEATEQFRRYADQVRIVVLDLAMPRMDGWMALEQIRSIRPDVPVILASGYDEAHARNNRPAYPALAFLHKPYTVAELRASVERLVDDAARCTELER